MLLSIHSPAEWLSPGRTGELTSRSRDPSLRDGPPWSRSPYFRVRAVLQQAVQALRLAVLGGQVDGDHGLRLLQREEAQAVTGVLWVEGPASAGRSRANPAYLSAHTALSGRWHFLVGGLFSVTHSQGV